MNKLEKHIKRIEYLNNMISKYKHRWHYHNCSKRIENWIEEYNTYSPHYCVDAEKIEAHEEACKRNGWWVGHTAYDTLA